MDRYRKLIIAFCFLLSINNLIQSQIVPDSLFFYLVAKDKQNVRNTLSMRLFVHNAGSDSIRITDFNRYIPHYSVFDFRQTQERIFYWELRTLSNQEVSEVLIIMPSMDSNTSKKRVEENNETITIPPNSTFISDVYMLFSPFVHYPKGYYKLCLFHNATKECIAETIIEIK